jgi:ATP-binding protein involved in chromosome partitioning
LLIDKAGTSVDTPLLRVRDAHYMVCFDDFFKKNDKSVEERRMNDVPITIDDVRAALAIVPGPEGKGLALAGGAISGVTLRGAKIGFVIDDRHAGDHALLRIRDEALGALSVLKGVESVTVLFAREHLMATKPARGPDPVLARTRRARLSGEVTAPPPRAQSASRLRIDHVAKVVAVASGKGGVGKSTIAANLAVAAAMAGKRVGLLDLDIYGPSVPTLFGLQGKEPAIGPHGKLEPLTAHGVSVMSIGFMVPADRAMIWRGPVVMSAVQQLLRDIDWTAGSEGGLDLLFLDLPPGTGDVQLTLVQRLAMDGAIIVSTPQALALADVRRGVRMFQDTAVPLLGIVENMSAMRGPDGAVSFAPFGHGGAREAAAELSMPFLGALPIDAALSVASDAGTPLALTPSTPSGQWFGEAARALFAALEETSPPAPPTIRFL